MKKINNKKYLNMAFANFIRDLRIKNNLTQDKLSEKLDIDPKHLSKLETAAKNITFDMFLKICEVLDIDSIDAFEIVFTNYRKSIDESYDIETMYNTKISNLPIDKQLLVLEIIRKIEKL